MTQSLPYSGPSEKIRIPSGITAVVLASGINRIPLFAGYTPGYKALLEFQGRASIHYVLDALEGVEEVDSVGIVGSEEALEPELKARGHKYRLAEGGDSLLRSVEVALREFGSGRKVLFVTADLPLITRPSIEEFLVGCRAVPRVYDLNIFIAVVPKSCYDGSYSQFPKTFNRFRDVTVCHGNLALVDARLIDVPVVRQRLDRMYAARKSGIGSALALGWKLGLTYSLGVEVLHILSLEKMASIASRSFGFGVVPVVVERPEITIDVDEPEDYAFVRERLKSRGP